MKKNALSLLLAVVMLLNFTAAAYAAATRSADISPRLTFQNGMAVCNVSCSGNFTTDKVVVNVTLYKGWDVVGAWSEQGTGYVSISEKVNAVKGAEYTMSVTWSVAGQWQDSVFTKKTYNG